MSTSFEKMEAEDIGTFPSDRSLMQRAHQYSKYTFIAVVISAVIFFALLVALLIEVSNTADQSPSTTFTTEPNGGSTTGGGSAGESEVLRILADDVLEAMDRSADPCENFYQYACGGWIEKTVLPDDRSAWVKSFSTISEENDYLLKEILEEDWPVIGQFYSNCMDVPTIDARGTEPLAQWVTMIEQTVDMDTLSHTVAAFHNYSMPALFNMYIDADAENPDYNIVNLYQGGLGLPNKQYYFASDAHSVELRAAYVNHIANYLALLGQQNTAELAASVMAFETSLAAISLSPEEERDPTAVYHKMTFQQLEELSPSFSWTLYFSAINAPTIQSLNIAMPNFTKNMDVILSQTDMGVIRSYLSWKLVRSTAGRLSSAFVDEEFDWRQIFTGVQQAEPRWMKCVAETTALLGDILSRYYVDKHFPGASRETAHNLVVALEEAFAEDFQNLEWMDSPTRQQALNKLGKISNKIGYPDHWESFDSIHVMPSRYFENVHQLLNFENGKVAKSIGQPVDKSKWYMAATEVNAYYNPFGNEIVFPAAILQPPFFKLDYPAWRNFGGIGAVIGHEITHGFDDQGSQFNGDGKLENWWTQTARAAFEDKAQCIVDQYSSYEVLPNLFINGGLTEGENLADNGGIRIAYNALQKWKTMHGDGGYSPELLAKYFPGLTEDQLYFISFGQVWCSVSTDGYKEFLTQTNPHSYPKFRAVGPTSNSDKFWSAFNCPVGTEQHPENACKVW